MGIEHEHEQWTCYKTVHVRVSHKFADPICKCRLDELGDVERTVYILPKDNNSY